MLVGKENVPVKAHVKKRFFSLLRPYLFFSVLAIAWHAFLWYGFQCTEVSTVYLGKDLLLRDVAVTVGGMGIGTLWFLPVLFVVDAMLVIVISYICKSPHGEENKSRKKSRSDENKNSKENKHKVEGKIGEKDIDSGGVTIAANCKNGASISVAAFALIVVLFFLFYFFHDIFEAFSEAGGVNLTAEGNLVLTVFYKYCQTFDRICLGFAYGLLGYLLGSWRRGREKQEYKSTHRQVLEQKQAQEQYYLGQEDMKQKQAHEQHCLEQEDRKQKQQSEQKPYTTLGMLLMGIVIAIVGKLTGFAIPFEVGCCVALFGVCFLLADAAARESSDSKQMGEILKKPVICLVNALAWCGRYSLDITIIHYIFLRPLEVMVVNAFWVPPYDVRYGCLLLAINLPTTILCCKLFNLISAYRKIMGRSK